MRPLFHPSIEDVTVEAILHALSDPVRFAIFSQIAGSECSQRCSNFLQRAKRQFRKSTLSATLQGVAQSRSDSRRYGEDGMQNTTRCGRDRSALSGLIMAIVKAHKISVGPAPSGRQSRESEVIARAGTRKVAKTICAA